MKHTRLTFAAFVMLMVGLGSSDSLRGIFSPVFSSHFALSATQLGLIVTVSYIGNLVFLLVGGNVIERFEKKKALLALTGIWMAALAVFAFTDNYYLLLAGMFCAMGASTLLNTTLNLVTPLLFASSPAFFVNLLFFTQGIGTSGSQSLLGRYATDIGFWHKTNLVLLALGAAAVLLLAFSTVPGPRADGPHPAKRQSGVLKNRAALPLVFVFGFYFIAEHGVMNWLVAYATAGLGMEQAKASNYLAVFFGGVMLGRLVLSPLVDRLGILKSMGVFGSLSAVLYIAGVVGGGDDLAVPGHHRAHGHLAQRGGPCGLLQRRAHQLIVGHPIPLSASARASTSPLFRICSTTPGAGLSVCSAAHPKMSPMPSA